MIMVIDGSITADEMKEIKKALRKIKKAREEKGRSEVRFMIKNSQ